MSALVDSDHYIRALVTDMPSIMRFRGYCYLLVTSNRSSDFQVSSDVVLRNLENLTIGNSVYLAPGVIINAIGDIHLGDEVMVGFNSVLNSGNHTIKDNSYRYGDKHILPIYVAAGAWIAANCTITAGSNIGLCTLIAANSCYSGGSEDFAIYGGVPAVFIRYSKKC
jgi:maltose O-acetyltransferase